MEEIGVTKESDEEKRIDNILFPKLESLDLQYLPKLMRFCFGNLIEFPSLKDLKITGCPELKTFVSNSLSTNWIVNKELEEMNNCVTQSLFNEKVLVPNLLEMKIDGIDNLRMICHDKLAPDSFCQLKEIDVTNCKNLMNIFPSNVQRRLRSLEKLKVTNCEVLEDVFEMGGTNVIQTCDVVPTQWRSLYLYNLPKLKHIWNMNPQGSLLTFQNLQSVTVKNCRSLKSPFPASVAKHLTQLKSLEIFECGVEYIVAKAEGLETEPKFVFPSLNSLELQNLPELRSFCLGKHTSEWLSLKELKIINCGKLEILALDSLSFQEANGLGHHGVSFEQPLFLIEKVSFQNLTTLIVRNCDSLKYLLSSSVARSLVQLQDLKIFKCKLMEEIGVTKESDEEKSIDNKLYPKLKSLDLQDLPKLMRFCFGNLIEFPSLKDLKITDCPKLKTFVSNSLSTNLIVNKELEEMNNCVTQSLFNEKVAVPNLETMVIKGIYNLRMIWHDKLAPNSFCQLKLITVTDCENLMNIFPKFVFPSLNFLRLQNLPELKSFYLGKHWPLLKYLEIENCGKVKIFASDSFSFQETQGQGPHGVSFEQPLFLIEKASFAELEELTLRRNFAMNEIWHGHIPIDLARFKGLYLDELPELEHLSKEDPFFQNIEILDISKCNKLKNLMSSSISFQNLTSLSVRNCHGFLNLITSPKTLVQLTTMDIVNCKNITEIVANKGGEVGDDELLFSKLKFLALRGLPSLTSFYLGNCNIKFPSLKSVIVNGCPELKIFSPGIVTTPKLQRLELSKKCIYTWRNDDEADVVVTPTEKLEEVDLNVTVKTFWKDNFSKSKDQSFKVNTGSDKDKEHDIDDDSETERREFEESKSVNTSSNEDDSEAEQWFFYDSELDESSEDNNWSKSEDHSEDPDFFRTLFELGSRS